MKILLKNGRVIDPANNLDDSCDVLVENSRIAKVGKGLKNGADQTIDCGGKLVLPGLVDMHVHLREPGREDKETIASGTAAAVKGGITTVLAMPNTQPAIDSPDTVQMLRDLIRDTAVCRVLLSGAITRNRAGQQLTNIARLKREGIVAVTDDGSSVDSEELMLKALRKAKEAHVLPICHSEDKALSAGGAMNLSAISTRLGLRGIPRESEYRRVERDIKLAEKARCAVHIAHVSCAESVEIIARAKKRSARVSCETAPHYFSLTEEAVLDYDANKKMNPPLRTQADVDAIRQGLAKGTIDCIASDHAPHTIADKEIEFDRAEFGVTGLETELAVAITELIDTNIISWPELVRRMSLNPARILGLGAGTLSAGASADITVVDPGQEWVVDKQGFVSKSRNSCFLGRKLRGLVAATLCAGKIAYKQQR